jgi:hypothetical protein
MEAPTEGNNEAAQQAAAQQTSPKKKGAVKQTMSNMMGSDEGRILIATLVIFVIIGIICLFSYGIKNAAANGKDVTWATGVLLTLSMIGLFFSFGSVTAAWAIYTKRDKSGVAYGSYGGEYYY